MQIVYLHGEKLALIYSNYISQTIKFSLVIN